LELQSLQRVWDRAQVGWQWERKHLAYVYRGHGWGGASRVAYEGRGGEFVRDDFGGRNLFALCWGCRDGLRDYGCGEVFHSAQVRIKSDGWGGSAGKSDSG